uniref:DUF6142 family protein n=1 Tax=Agathobacter sp. TaxID=2021311 RepID=UPI00405630ED
MRRKKRSYKFTGKKHSIRGLVSFGMACVILVIYGIFMYLSYKGGGNLSAYYGGAGVMVMLLSFVALAVAMLSLKEENSFQLFPRMAAGLSTLSVICWCGTYILGFL